MFYLISTFILFAILCHTSSAAPKDIMNEAARGFAAVTAFIVIVIWTLFNSVYQVPAGHVGLVYAFGDIIGQEGEGLKFVAPWKSVWAATAQVQKVTFQKENHLASFSKESQDVYVDATVNVRVLPKDIENLYRNVGTDYMDTIVRPRIRQAFKDETVKYSTVDVAPHREQIRHAVSKRLSDELAARSIVVDDLLIDNVSFNPKFQDSIERKQIASQDALAEEQRIAGERNKAQQAIEIARGAAEATLINALKQAEANRALAASITPELVQYQMVQRLAPTVHTILLPVGAPFILDKSILAPAK
jgi:regulator of protease activity HflC (stomatin/prohibitin superfamily)